MKHKTLFALLAAGVLLASCSKDVAEEGNGPVPDDEQPVAIRLSSGIDATEAESKAPIMTNAAVRIEGWESVTAPNYTTASTWNSTANVSVNSTAAGITLSPARYYNADGSVKTYIKGWYPTSTPSNGTVNFSNTSGTMDVLYADGVSGSKSAVVSSPLVFKHKTAQLVFKVKSGAGLASGTKIKTIKVKNTAVPTSLNLSTNTVGYTSKTELAVPNITVAEIGSTETVAGQPLMVRPEANLNTVKLYIETVKSDGTTAAATYDNVALTTSDNKLTEGSAYTVTLTFKQSGISVNANISPWTSATGSADVI